MENRIQKILARLGYGSRRSCEKLIVEGRVTLGGRTVGLGETCADGREHLLAVDGVAVRGAGTPFVLLFNKPADAVTTVSDPQGRRTVMDLLSEQYRVGPQRVYPVGRLDRETEGVLLLTNDGELTHRLLHPSAGVDKEYRAKIELAGWVSEALDELSAGPTLKDGPTRPPRAVKLKGDWIYLTIHEGRKRQVRRMLYAVGLRCLYLERTSFAGLTCRGLARGQYRRLTDEEYRDLRGKASL